MKNPRAIYCLLLFFLSLQTDVQAVEVSIKVVEIDSKMPLPCRIHLKNDRGQPIKAPGLPWWRDHFVCPGTVKLQLPEGNYTYVVERGPEYRREGGGFKVDAKAQKLEITLKRIANLQKEEWFAGDLHIHRPVADVPLLMQAEDLHIGPVITWWNNHNAWSRVKRLPKDLLRSINGNRFYHVMAGEDERGGGALLYFNLKKPLPIGGSAREHPSSVKFLHEAAKANGIHVDIEKPFWWDVPLWLATGEADTMGLANNHMCRDRMYESEAWGKPRDTMRLPPPRGNGFWTQEVYYHILNSGIRMPPSAGSASGVLPNPVGYNRVYVKVNGKLTWDKWWQGLRAGRSFVTNGPLLQVTANDRNPGHVFQSTKAIDISIQAKLTTQDPIESLELIHNGKVVKAIKGKGATRINSLGTLTFKESGWFLARAITANRQTFRFASSAPFYVEVGEKKHRISQQAVQFFLQWLKEREQTLKKALKDEQQEEVLLHLREAKKFWRQRLKMATAP